MSREKNETKNDGFEGEKQPVDKQRRLKNGNIAGDLSQVARCGAKTRQGGSCQQPGMSNGRCRFHGGLSTGAKTPEGKERVKKGNYKHGEFSAEKLADKAAFREVKRAFAELPDTFWLL